MFLCGAVDSSRRSSFFHSPTPTSAKCPVKNPSPNRVYPWRELGHLTADWRRGNEPAVTSGSIAGSRSKKPPTLSTNKTFKKKMKRADLDSIRTVSRRPGSCPLRGRADNLRQVCFVLVRLPLSELSFYVETKQGASSPAILACQCPSWSRWRNPPYSLRSGSQSGFPSGQGTRLSRIPTGRAPVTCSLACASEFGSGRAPSRLLLLPLPLAIALPQPPQQTSGKFQAAAQLHLPLLPPPGTAFAERALGAGRWHGGGRREALPAAGAESGESGCKRPSSVSRSLSLSFCPPPVCAVCERLARLPVSLRRH